MSNYKIKETHPVVIFANGHVRIGDEPGFMSLVEDEGGAFKTLLPLIDGHHTIAEMAGIMQTTHPDLDEIEIAGAIAQLDENLHLELVRPEFDLAMLSRNSANLRYFGNFLHADRSPAELQDKFSRMSVALVGLGGLGSTLLMQLVGLGFERFFAIEPDVVEEKNLNRQLLYSYSDVGTPKLDAAAKNICKLNPRVTLTGAHDLVSSQNQLNMLLPSGIDVVFCAADTPPLLIQSWCNQVALMRGVPFFCGGVGVTQGSFFSCIPSATPCIDCTYKELESLTPDDAEVAEAYRAMTFVNAAVTPTIGLIASLMTNEWIKLLLALESPLIGKKVDVDFLDVSITPLELPEINCKCSENLQIRRGEYVV